MTARATPFDFKVSLKYARKKFFFKSFKIKPLIIKKEIYAKREFYPSNFIRSHEIDT